MQCNPNHMFLGSLSSKNKSELGDILIALRIFVDAKMKKANMVKCIQDHFIDPSHIKDCESPRFSGLFPGACHPCQLAHQLGSENNPPPHPQWPGIYQPTPGPLYSCSQTLDYRYHPYTTAILPQSYYHLQPVQFSHGASSVMTDSRNFDNITHYPPPPPQM